MKKYYCDGLLPEVYLAEAFERLYYTDCNTIGEAFNKMANEIAKEYSNDWYNYIYEMEPYANDVVRNEVLPEPFCISDALECGVRNYLLQTFYDNIYTFMENYTEMKMLSMGVKEELIRKMNILEFVGYSDKDTSLKKLSKRIKTLVHNTCLCR